MAYINGNKVLFGVRTVNAWDMVQQYVRMGVANKFFKIGDQLECWHETYGTLVWDIIGIDHDTPYNQYRHNHSITLQLHDCIDVIKFDDLSNSWENSYIRNWINDEKDGFLKGLDPAFLNVISRTEKRTANWDDGISSYYEHITYDKFFLLSSVEVGAEDTNGGFNEGAVYPYYADAETGNTKRIKTYPAWGKEVSWFLRSPRMDYTPNISVKRVNPNGIVGGSGVDAEQAISLACCIY